MSLELKQISESDFEKMEVPILFEEKLTDRSFGIILNQKHQVKFKFGWQSTDIKPVTLLINGYIYSIGIDLTFVIFDFENYAIIKKISLTYFFYDSSIYNDYLYVITEIEIIKVGILNFEIEEIYSLPDYFESIDFKKESICVKCINGEIINIE